MSSTSWYFVFLILAFIDIFATDYEIQKVGGDTSLELNPLMRWVMDEHGMDAAYLVRLLIPAVFLPFILYTRNRNQTGKVCFWVLLVAHVGVVVWHAYNIGFYWLT